MKVVKTRRGARLVEGDVVLSEILKEPGFSNTLFDVLAACVAALAPGPRVALLGFAGGGMIAPLRAMGFRHPVAAVDLDLKGEKIFRDLCSAWAGEVSVAQADAVSWLASRRRRYDMIVEDLSVPSPVGTVKPYATFDRLPGLIRARLKPDGLALINLLPLPGTSWPSMAARVAMPYERALAVRLDEYENRFLLAGDRLPSAARVSARLRATLRAIGSDQAGKIAVAAPSRVPDWPPSD